ncbi:hypothetical protein [Paenibacillus alba]|uniref:Uncharacterized protein n=1 Tax=Paenibacillus alba TaxID=1197127 RepID=A0ABU6FVY6_9BACL|nr:hypothetical protein [Paenibacillus alba]MEC0226058.1 hypothetical protein [Paenibacillus alba]
MPAIMQEFLAFPSYIPGGPRKDAQSQEFNDLGEFKAEKDAQSQEFSDMG